MMINRRRFLTSGLTAAAGAAALSSLGRSAGSGPEGLAQNQEAP